MPAVEVWFLGGPIDGRLAPVEVDETGTLPQVVQLLQAGFYLGVADNPSQPIEHQYVHDEAETCPPVYRYAGPAQT
ncbi:hypothetical protein [Micromonospora avicenniae]|uniref:Uncharacterized protein n=1 Tax=Micromonospora avicenniae TaxID=1198245 RepID=A0A1N7ERB0_9ACTN|nr:hypothetical protein [Micromonospora avicenniae]SIR90600.1 hypothetical protein SAMN05444858_12648 [Micromonospora avicenniae]